MPDRTYVCARCGVTAEARSPGGKLPAHCDDCFLIVYGRRRDRTPRKYTCAECGVVKEHRKGILPERCSDCRKPPAAKALSVAYSCPDCGGELQSGKVRRCAHCGSGPSADGVRFKPLKTHPSRICKACGAAIDPSKEAGTIYCPGSACKEWARRCPGVLRPKTPTLICEQCGGEFQPKPKSKYSKVRFCSVTCNRRWKHLARPFGEWRKEDPYPRRPCVCEDCGERFWDCGVGSQATKCDPCKGEVRARYQRAASKYRHQLLSMASVDGIRFKHVDIFERDGWICQLCNRPVDPALRRPDLQSPSLDHVLPLSKGGLHVPENVQLAHWICNSRKGNRRIT